MKRKGCMTESAHFGQTIITETGPDRSSHKLDHNQALAGKPMKGGPTDVSHSISGGSVNDYNDKKSARG
jgi:hypothetical protein